MSLSDKEKAILAELAPQVRDRMVDLRGRVEAALATLGPYRVRVISGVRTMAEQLRLYATGREKVSEDPAPWGTWRRIGKTVTNAKPGDSAHNYGLAADFAIVDPHGPGAADDEWCPDTIARPSGRVWHPAWVALGDCARLVGLETGFHWRPPWDLGHAQAPDWRAIVASMAVPPEIR